MRFATFENDGAVRAGVVIDGPAGPMVHPLPVGTTVLDLVRAGLPAALKAGTRAQAEPGIAVDQVRLLPPLTPPTVRDFVVLSAKLDEDVGVISGVDVL